MVIEVRIYTMKTGKLDEFERIFIEQIMPTSATYGVRIHAAWRHEEKNEFVWIRSYDDTATLERYSNSSERAAYMPLAGACVDSIDVRVVEPVIGSLPVAN
jgi:quinol monooxygenase YgiN